MSSTSTTKTDIPDPTPEELGLLNLVRDGMLTSYMEEAGYEVTKSSTSWADSDDAKNFQSREAVLQQRISTLNQSLNGVRNGYEREMAINQINQAQNDLFKVQDDSRKAQADFKPEIAYTTRHKSDLETEAVLEKYGADSPEYKQAKSNYDQQQITVQKQQQDLSILTMNAAEKFLKGDYSVTTDQQQFVDSMLGPVKEAGLKAIDYITTQAGLNEGKLQAAADQIAGQFGVTEKGLRGELSKVTGEIQNTAKSMNKALGTFRDQVKQTGMDMGDAILELEQRTRQTGSNMGKALEESIKYSEALTKMGIEDFSLATRNAVASQAATLGRAPTDPEFISQMQSQVNRQIAQAGLQFGQMSSQGRMGIAERTGSGLENAAMLRLNAANQTGQGLQSAAQMGLGIAERTGAAMENAAQTGLGIAERTGAGLEGVSNLRYGIASDQANAMLTAAQMRGQVETGAAETRSNMTTQLGMNQPLQSIQSGLQVGQYNQALEQARLSNAQAAMQAPFPLINYYQQERMAEPTQTTKTSMGVGSILGGIAGAGMSMAGAAGGLGWNPFGK